MKIVKKVLERRFRRIMKVDEMQFSFIPGKGTINAVFILRRLYTRRIHRQGKEVVYVLR